VLRPGGTLRSGLVAAAPAEPAPPRAGQGARCARAACASCRCLVSSDTSGGGRRVRL